MSVTKWSDAADWSDLANDIPTVDMFEAIRLALLERLSLLEEKVHIQSWYIPGVSLYPPEPTWDIGQEIELFEPVDFQVDGTGGNRNFGYMVEFWLDLLIPLFCNLTTEHTWDGLSLSFNAPITYTEASLMAELGESRIRLSHGGEFGLGAYGLSAELLSADWLKQQHDIINKLTCLRVDWSHLQSGGPSQEFGSTSNGRKSAQTGPHADWATAKTATEAAYAAAVSKTAVTAPMQQTAGNKYVGSYEGLISTVKNSVAVPVMHRFAADVDFYGRIQGYNESDAYDITGVESWIKIGTTSIAKATPPNQPGRPLDALAPAYVYSPVLGSINRPIPWVSQPSSGSWFGRGWQLTDYAAAVKYDSDPVNGLQFIAP